MKKAIERIFIFIVSILVPIAVFALTYRREAKVMFAFVEYLLDAYLWQLAGAAALLVAAWFTGMRITQGSFSIPLRRLLLRRRWAVVFCAAIIFGFLGQLVRLEYRVFSEVWYQRRALAALTAGNLLRSRLICDRYLELFPQRTMGGSYPDPVCVPLRVFLSRAGALRTYISKHRPVSARVDGLFVGVAWETRREALQILDRWSGGVTSSPP